MTNCPACHSDDIHTVEPFRVKQKGAGALPDDYIIFECTNCGLWFKDEFPPEEKLIKYYQGLSLSDDNWDYEKRLPHEKKLDDLLSTQPAGTTVLDVGCWTGRLLSIHTHLKRYGIEPNHDSAKIATEKGLDILGVTVTEQTLAGQSFDIITLIDVFEHLNNPVEIIEILLNHLTPNGKIVIVTGRTDSFPVKLVSTTYWYFSVVPDHIVFLNKRFVNWLQQHFACKSVTAVPMCHYNFNFRKYTWELTWLLIWRYLNPNSPFKKSKLARLPIFKRFANWQDIIICTNWKDHYYITIQK